MVVYNNIAEYFNHVTKILKTSLKSNETAQAINTFAVPFILYGFLITELEDSDPPIRKLLCKHHMLLKKSGVDRLYVSKSKRERGLLNISDIYKTQIITYNQ